MKPSEKLLVLFSLGWTQFAIEKETGIPQATISRIAAGNDPRASNAATIDVLYQREVSLQGTKAA